MAAYDNVNLPGAPNIAQAGNYAQMLMEGIGNLRKAYQDTQDFQYKQRQQNMFQDPDAMADLRQYLQTGNGDALVQRIVKAGGAPSVAPLMQQILAGQGARATQDVLGGDQPQGQNPTPPAAGSVSQITGQQPQRQSASSAGSYNPPKVPYTGADDGYNTRSLTAQIGGENGNASQAVMQRFASIAGVDDPDADLTADQVNKLRPIIGNYFGRTGGGSPGGGGGGAPAGAGGVNPVAQPGAESESNQPTPTGVGGSSAISPAPSEGAGRIAPSVPQRTAQATAAPARAGDYSPPSTAEIQAKEAFAKRAEITAADPRVDQGRRELLRDAAKQATEAAKQMREERAAYFKPTEKGKDVESGAEVGAKASDALGKRIGETIEAGGKDARKTVNILDIMQDALKQGGDHIFAGPGSDIALKVKQAAANLGFDIKGTTESETIQKLNAQLASASAKALTQRPSQLEFKAFMANNPGLMTSTKGTLVLIDILRQLTKQDIELGRKATNQANWKNWSDVEDDFYKHNPIKSPYTGKALKDDEVVPGLGGTPASGGGAGKRYRWTPEGLQAQ